MYNLLQLPGWIEQQPATEEEDPRGGEGNHHGNRKRPSPKDSPPTQPAKLARMDSLEVATAAAPPAAPRGGSHIA